MRITAAAGTACARATSAGSTAAPPAPATVATDSPTASRFEPNERASETATSDPMLESGEPITRISPPRPALHLRREPRGEHEGRVDVAVLRPAVSAVGRGPRVAERDEVEALQHAP